MSVESIQAIDVHAHFGTYARDPVDPLVSKWLSADAETAGSRAWNAAGPAALLMSLATRHQPLDATPMSCNAQRDLLDSVTQ